MALVIYLGTASGDPVMYSFDDVTNDSAHGVIRASLPSLSLKLEDNFTQFSSGSLSFEAMNEDGYWTTEIGSLNPYDRFPTAPFIDISRDGVHRWRGTIDPRSVKFDSKEKKVAFTAIGILGALDQYSAENVKRDVPDQADFGVGVGSSGRLTDTSKTWKKSQFTNHVLIDSAGTMFTCQSIIAVGDPDLDYVKVTGTPASGPYMLRPYAWKTCETNGARGTGYLNLFIADGATWSADEWNGYYLHDAAGAVFEITDTLTSPSRVVVEGTPASGKYSIRAASHARLMESLGPTPVAMGLLPGDILHLACALQVGVSTRFISGGGGEGDPWYKFLWSTPRFGVATQDVKIKYVGPRASNPTLTAQEIWLEEDLETDFGPGDGCFVATPYHRDGTVASLTTLLALELALASAVNVETFSTSDLVPYADFKNKSIGAALVELATISGAVVVIDIRGNHPGAITLIVNRRDQAYSKLVKDVSASVMTREDSVSWEHWYDSVKVSGADGREIVRGSPRFGGQSLEVSSDFVNNYTWLRQIAERLSDFFTVRRKVSNVRVLGEYRHPQSYYIVRAADLGIDVAELYAAWTEDSTWRVLGTGIYPYVSTVGGTSPAAAHYTPIASSLDCDLLMRCYTTSAMAFPGIGIRVSGSGGSRNGYFASFDTANDVFAILKWDNNFGAPVASVSVPGLVQSTQYKVRFKVTTVAPNTINIQAKIWAASGAEPAEWNIDTYDAFALSSPSQPALYAAIVNGHERFVEFGDYDGQAQIAGFNLLDRVQLEEGGEEWWVIAVDEPLEDPLPYVDLTLLQATGAAVTPPDDFETRDASMPEPPAITNITRSTSPKEFVIEFDWDGDSPNVLGFYITHWLATDARPAGLGAFVRPEWVTDHWEYTLPYDPLPASNTRYVDLQIVMLDGRTSDPCEAVYLP